MHSTLIVPCRIRVVKSGAENPVDTAGACAKQCTSARTCNAWFWCNDAGGCRSEADTAVPLHGCELQAQAPVFPIEPPMAWPISKFVAGFAGGEHPTARICISIVMLLALTATRLSVSPPHVGGGWGASELILFRCKISFSSAA